jgi:hypothetical protein
MLSVKMICRSRARSPASRVIGADPGRTQIPPDLPVGPLLHDLASRVGLAPSSQVVAIVASASASVRGFLSMEIFGSLRQSIPDTDRLYRAHVRTIMTGMGFIPAAPSCRKILST